MTTYMITNGSLHPGLTRSVEVLLVEDSPSDVAMTVAAMREGEVANVLHVVRDGEEAMSFLRRFGAHKDMPRPDLIILDLNLPRMDGRDVLREVKSDEALRDVPIVVLTTSTHDADIKAVYSLHGNAYIVKPMDYEAFRRAVKGIESFWMELARLPDGSGDAGAGESSPSP